MKYTCPICDRAFTVGETPPSSLPFCSSQCKMVDLGNWLDEKYKLAGQNEWEGQGDMLDRDRNREPGPGSR